MGGGEGGGRRGGEGGGAGRAEGRASKPPLAASRQLPLSRGGTNRAREELWLPEPALGFFVFFFRF